MSTEGNQFRLENLSLSLSRLFTNRENDRRRKERVLQWDRIYVLVKVSDIFCSSLSSGSYFNLIKNFLVSHIMAKRYV